MRLSITGFIYQLSSLPTTFSYYATIFTINSPIFFHEKEGRGWKHFNFSFSGSFRFFDKKNLTNVTQEEGEEEKEEEQTNERTNERKDGWISFSSILTKALKRWEWRWCWPRLRDWQIGGNIRKWKDKAREVEEAALNGNVEKQRSRWW